MASAPIHPAELLAEPLLAECDIEFLRRSGPGGQHRNKVSTAVALRHRPTGVRAEASERRSQAENRTVAAFRLRLNLALEVRIRRAACDVPSTLWQSRCRTGRISISPTHDDFPGMLAEALDVVVSCDLDPKPAADLLQCSVSQLIKLLKKEPQAFAWLNRQRLLAGLHALQ